MRNTSRWTLGVLAIVLSFQIFSVVTSWPERVPIILLGGVFVCIGMMVWIDGRRERANREGKA